MSHINIKCEVHMPENIADKIRRAIDDLNDNLPEEYKLVAVKTKGGVVVKKEDLD